MGVESARVASLLLREVRLARTLGSTLVLQQKSAGCHQLGVWALLQLRCLLLLLTALQSSCLP